MASAGDSLFASYFLKNKRYLSILSLPQKLLESTHPFPIGFQKKKKRILSKMKPFWMKGVKLRQQSE